MRKNLGFTLIELLVVLMLTSILMTALGGILWQVSRNVSHAEQARAEALDIYAVFEQFSKDVYAYKSDFSALSDKELSFNTFKDNTESLTPEGSRFAIKYEIKTENGITYLKRTERALALNVNPVTNILWQVPNPEDKAYIYFGYRNAHTFLPIWTNPHQAPFGLQLNITDKNGEKWQRAIPIIAGHEERL